MTKYFPMPALIVIVLLVATMGCVDSSSDYSSRSSATAPVTKPYQVSPVSYTATQPLPEAQTPDEKFLLAYAVSKEQIRSSLGGLSTGHYEGLLETATNDYFTLSAIPVSNSLKDVKSSYISALRGYQQAGELFRQGYSDIDQGQKIQGTEELNTAGAYLQQALSQDGYTGALLQGYYTRI